MHQIVRYSNRKLYSKKIKKYVTLNDVKTFVDNNETISVLDNTTKTDITYSTMIGVLSTKLGTLENKSTDSIVNLIKSV